VEAATVVTVVVKIVVGFGRFYPVRETLDIAPTGQAVVEPPYPIAARGHAANLEFHEANFKVDGLTLKLHS
jgi:hypothetical protein